MNKLFLSLLLLTGLSVAAQTPGGEWTIGARLGGSSGISLKKYNATNTGATELIASWNLDEDLDGFGITALFEKLAKLGNGPKLNAIIGVGPTVAFADETLFGVAGILGFDWRVSTPIGLQLDWSPAWYFVNESEFAGANAAFTIRYNLRHRKIRQSKGK